MLFHLWGCNYTFLKYMTSDISSLKFAKNRKNAIYSFFCAKCKKEKYDFSKIYLNDLGHPPWKRVKGSDSLSLWFFDWLWSNITEKHRLNTLRQKLNTSRDDAKSPFLDIFQKLWSQFNVILEIWAYIGNEYVFYLWDCDYTFV